LPVTLNGTQIFLGGQAMPLSYGGPNQVNALVPQNLNPNASYQMVVARGATRSVPSSITIAALQPGIYTADTSGTGQGIIEIAGTALLSGVPASGARPVQSGKEFLAIFCTGLGAVTGPNGEAPPADGAPAGGDVLYRTKADVQVTVGGVNVPVLFAGLTPSLVALYQINVPVPREVPAGTEVPVVVTATDRTTGAVIGSNTVTIAVQ
jgi:uncharacterized protein (TIGR03437 family)